MSTQPGVDVSIICVNWNSVDFLKKCLASVYEHTRKLSFEVIVVDNASPQGGVEVLKDLYPEITIIKSKENLGFSRANNLGFRNSKGRYALFLNPDTELLNNSIELVVKQMEQLPDAGIVGPTLRNTDMSIQTESIQKFPTILNQLLDIEYLRLRWPQFPLWNIAPLFRNNDKPVLVEVIPGASMMFRREVFEEVGMFSEDYFMYAEDIDLNFKVKQKGYKNYYVGWAQVVHHGGSSSKQQRASHWSTIMKFRAMMTFYKKNRGGTYALMYRTAMGCGAAGRLILLGLSFPLSSNKERVAGASAKWGTVLKCAVGLTKLA